MSAWATDDSHRHRRDVEVGFDIAKTGPGIQFSPIWVVGLEADIQGALEKDSSTFSTPFHFSYLPFPTDPTLKLPVTGSAVAAYSAQIDWFGTVRLRAGYVWG